MDTVSTGDRPDDDPVATYGYVMMGSLLVVPMALRADLSLVANAVSLLGATAGLLHVQQRTMHYPVGPEGIIDERDYTILLLGVGAYLGADYMNYRVTAYFLLAGALASYWNGKVVAQRTAGARVESPPRRGRPVKSRSERSESL